MRILLIGAGPMGSLLAAKLIEAKNDVTVMARGQRLQDLRDFGIIIRNTKNCEEIHSNIKTVSSFAPDDDYELVIIVMRKNQALQLLPTLAANRRVKTFLFMMNNVLGAVPFADALGSERVMVGFPLPGGRREGHVIRVISGTDKFKWTIPVGEIDGCIRNRTKKVADVLGKMPGYKVEVRKDMDAWLKTHVALLIPGLVGAIYATGTDAKRLANTRDALVLASRATKEAFKALQKKGITIAPSLLKVVPFIPEPLFVLLLKKAATTKIMEISGIGHTTAAKDEMKMLIDEFMELIRGVDTKITSIEMLYPYFKSEQEPMPYGSHKIGVRWGELYLVVGVLVFIYSFLRPKRRKCRCLCCGCK
ncbi:2-dehydropantoate 2-reductase N-terminal domain-containing protein [Chitinispirillales bacterium ANBcel5]|uniref:ketopantoate reductase family protein n=1 Tax=Cellulosispirillum alkaliphilum TaxID=3039283 RepID=UPI002A4FEFA0|nr:2-dehydropantoate 2-reductase N-terminal domain-containing protein [Chitinispirillales bacterium ANBcel5]